MVEATVNKNMRKRERRVPRGRSWVGDKQETQIKKQERSDGRYRKKSRTVHQAYVRKEKRVQFCACWIESFCLIGDGEVGRLKFMEVHKSKDVNK